MNELKTWVLRKYYAIAIGELKLCSLHQSNIQVKEELNRLKQQQNSSTTTTSQNNTHSPLPPAPALASTKSTPVSALSNGANSNNIRKNTHITSPAPVAIIGGGDQLQARIDAYMAALSPAGATTNTANTTSNSATNSHNCKLTVGGDLGAHILHSRRHDNIAVASPCKSSTNDARSTNCRLVGDAHQHQFCAAIPRCAWQCTVVVAAAHSSARSTFTGDCASAAGNDHHHSIIVGHKGRGSSRLCPATTYRNREGTHPASADKRWRRQWYWWWPEQVDYQSVVVGR